MPMGSVAVISGPIIRPVSVATVISPAMGMAVIDTALQE
jgi:hypothetical protein